MTWTVELDPAAVIAGRTALNLNSGNIQVSNAGIDWGDAAIQQYLAEQRWGQTPVSYRVPNRTPKIPLLLGKTGGTIAEEEKARLELQKKVSLLQRQGGVLLRQRAGGEAQYADIVNATLTLPDVYGETGGVEPNVVLALETLPDFYGEEIELDAVEELGQIDAVLKKGGVAGRDRRRLPGAVPDRAHREEQTRPAGPDLGAPLDPLRRGGDGCAVPRREEPDADQRRGGQSRTPAAYSGKVVELERTRRQKRGTRS